NHARQARRALRRERREAGVRAARNACPGRTESGFSAGRRNRLTRAEGCRRGRIAACRLRLARVREPFRLLLELGPALDGRIESRPGLVELTEHRLDLVARPSVEVGLRDALLERRDRLLQALDLVRQRVEL